MNIKVLGTGCVTCKKLYESVVSVVKELNLETKVEYITDVQAILDLGVMLSPVLVIDDVAVAIGQVPSSDKIKQFITEGEKNKGAIKENPDGACGCKC